MSDLYVIMKYRLFAFLAALLLLPGCEPDPFLSVEETQLDFPAEGGSATLHFVANKDWSVSSEESWCTVTPASGEGGKGEIVLTVKCDRYEGYDDRSTAIALRCENLQKRVSVTQSSKGVLIIEKTRYEFGYEAQTLKVSVRSNKDYEVNIAEDSQAWIHLVDTKGLRTSSFTLNIGENETPEREGTVYVTAESEVITLKIKQEDGTVTLPDPNFLTYCLANFDKNGDGFLSRKEAGSVQLINVKTENVSSLEGIEFFTDLQVLSCNGGWNQKDDECTGQLTSLDLSKNTALTELYCEANQLTTLDLSKNTALTMLYCGHNQLKSLDLSKNTALFYLVCYYNQLTSLTITRNSALTVLFCSFNQLKSLNVSGNPALETIVCESNLLTDINLSKNPALMELHCQDNPLTGLDVSKNAALTWLYCKSCGLTRLDVSNNQALAYLNCGYNQLKSLDVSKNPALKELYCYYNPLTSLDVSNNTALEKLYCWSATLTDLYLAYGQTFKEHEWEWTTTVHYK